MNPKQAKSPVLKIASRRALAMIWSYARGKLSDQAKAVAFVVLYLLLAQLLVFRVPVANALGVALGIGATVLGLALFLEGLFLGVMPLGEHCGLKLPGKAGPALIAIFSFILGAFATLAEPAIGFLKAQGESLLPWENPLLYLLLNRGSEMLVWTVAGGVGLAVLLGVFRFLYNWPFKPFVYVLIPGLLLISVYFERNPVLVSSVGLAWDTGGVTTGPVTVPLVIALGMGVSRIAGSGRGGTSSLGVVTLASALPVMAVFGLAFALAPQCPQPSDAVSYFSTESRAAALHVAGDEAHLRAQALKAIKAGQLTAEAYEQAFGEANTNLNGLPAADEAGTEAGSMSWVLGHASAALKSVVPLSLFLIAVIMLFLRDRLRGTDEIALGLAFAAIGMFFINMGIEQGLSALGRQSGAALPRAYIESERDDKAVYLRGVDSASVFSVATPEGPQEYLWIEGEEGAQAVPFDRSHWDEEGRGYLYVPKEKAVFASWGDYAGIIAVLVFVFILGFGATLAEPSLTALGITVEELTTGTYRKGVLIANVAVGVGMGMAVGFARILYDFPLTWVLVPSYALAIVLTAVSSEEFAAIAWDSAGVTTGPVTVPLVIAAGLGIGGGSASSFGVVALASVFPVLAVLASGILSQARARQAVTGERYA